MTTKHKADDLIRAVEKKYGSKNSVLREVTIVDPIESQISLAYWNSRYPDHYRKHLEKRGISAEDLPPIPDGYYAGMTPTVRRIDALMLSSMDKHGRYPATAIEVKVSRADFKRDTDAKRRAWMSVAHRFIYLVPEGLVAADEVPDECGLWYWIPHVWGGAGRIDIIKRAKVNHHPENFDEYFTSYMVGRAARAENRLRELKRQGVI